MKKKNLKVYAGAVLLAGAITIGGIALHHKLPSKSEVLATSINVDWTLNITMEMDKVHLENGQILYSLPNGYRPYHVNPELEKASILEVYNAGDFTQYLVSTEENLDGYIGVKEDYYYHLMYLDSLRERIESKDPTITTDLTKLESHNLIALPQPYFLEEGYELLVVDYVERHSEETEAIPYVKEENGTVYGLSNSLKYIGVTADVSKYLAEAEKLEEYVIEEYYNNYEKTNNRSK